MTERVILLHQDENIAFTQMGDGQAEAAAAIEIAAREGVWALADSQGRARITFWQGSDPNTRLLRRKERDASRGSPRSLAAQKALAQDDKTSRSKSYLASRSLLITNTIANP